MTGKGIYLQNVEPLQRRLFSYYLFLANFPYFEK
jgi:hypothetical protein